VVFVLAEYQLKMKSVLERLFGFLFIILILVICLFSFGRLRNLSDELAIEHRPEFPTGTLSDRVRFSAYNIAHGRGPVLGQSNWQGKIYDKRTRLELIGTFLKQSEADVVVLNEVDFSARWSGNIDQATIVADAGEFPFIAKQINYDILLPGLSLQFGNAVLSRFPIRSANRVVLPALNPLEVWFGGNHDVIETDIALSEDISFKFWGLHLEVRNEKVRIQAVEKIMQTQINDALVVMAGDLNSQPASDNSSTAYDVFTGTHGFHSFPRSGAQMHTFPTQAPNRTLDWVLYSAGWQFVKGEVSEQHYSDHLPVLVDLNPR